jgi:hypothetical protein
VLFGWFRISDCCVAPPLATSLLRQRIVDAFFDHLMPLPPRGFMEFRVLFNLGFAGSGGLLQRRFVRTCLRDGSVGRECKSAEENHSRKPLELDHLVSPSF